MPEARHTLKAIKCTSNSKSGHIMFFFRNYWVFQDSVTSTGHHKVCLDTISVHTIIMPSLLCHCGQSHSRPHWCSLGDILYIFKALMINAFIFMFPNLRKTVLKIPTNLRIDLVHSIYMLFCSFRNAWFKVFLYNCLKRQQQQQCVVFRLLALCALLYMKIIILNN